VLGEHDGTRADALDLDEVLAADAWARRRAGELLDRV
jgi:hypothetical protein